MSGRIYAAIILAVSLLIGFTSRPQTSEPQETPAWAANRERASTFAREIVASLSERKFAAVEEHFSPELKNQTPVDKLKEEWETLVARNGAFRYVDSASTGDNHGVEVCEVTVRFESALGRIVLGILLPDRVLYFSVLSDQDLNVQDGATQNSDERVARAFIADLAAHNFDSAEARFAPQVAGMLPKEKLAQAWDQINSQFGTFDSIQGARPNPNNPAVVTLICKFSHGMLDAILPFNDAHQLIGFRVVPSAESAAQSAWNAPDYAKPDSFTERDVTVGSAPWALPGTLTLPKGAGPFPAVVLVHGSGPEDRDEAFGPNKMFKDIAWGLASRGIAVLRYEKRTKLYGAQMMASTDPITVKSETEDDAKAAIALLAGTPGIDPKHIFLAGHSLGGYLAPRIATTDSQIAGLILFAGTTRPLEDDVVDQVMDQLTKAGQANSPEGQAAIAKAKADAAAIKDPGLKPGVMLSFAGTKIPSDYFLDLRNYDPVKVAQPLKIPILVLQGERDYQVTMVDFADWKNGLPGRTNVTLKSFPVLNHFFMPGTGPATPAEYNVPGHVEPDVIADVAAWVKAQAGPAKPSR